jgi:hypothetical protein
MGQDLTGPIPENTVRISVRFGPWLLIAEFEANGIMAYLASFERYVKDTADLRRFRKTLIGYEGASSVAYQAMQDGDCEVLALAALWMCIYRPKQEAGKTNREILKALIKRDGGAWLVSSTDEDGIFWTFTLSPIALSRYGDVAGPPPIPATGATLH